MHGGWGEERWRDDGLGKDDDGEKIKKHWVFVSSFFKRYTKIKRAVVPKERRGRWANRKRDTQVATSYARLVSNPMHRQDFPRPKAPATPGTEKKRERTLVCSITTLRTTFICVKRTERKKTAAARPQGNRTTTPPLRDRRSARERCAKRGVGKGHDSSVVTTQCISGILDSLV